MTPLTLLGAVGLTAIAAVAVLWPYQRGSAAGLQRLPASRMKNDNDEE